MHELIGRTSVDPQGMIVSPFSSMESLRYGDKLHAKHFPTKTAEEWAKKSDDMLFSKMFVLFDCLTTKPTLKLAALDMLYCFMYGKGRDVFDRYTNSLLNFSVASNSYFLQWLNDVLHQIAPNIRAIEDNPSYPIKQNLSLSSFAFGHTYNANRLEKIEDKIAQTMGLSILVNQVYAATIEVDRRSIKYYHDRSFTADFRITLYDDFGLDSGDIDRNYNDNVFGENFIAWYVLQHYRPNHRPFVTKIEIEKPYLHIPYFF